VAALTLAFAAGLSAAAGRCDGQRPLRAHVTAADLELLTELIEAAKVRPRIDRRYAFADLPSAIAYLEQGHARVELGVGQAITQTPLWQARPRTSSRRMLTAAIRWSPAPMTSTAPPRPCRPSSRTHRRAPRTLSICEGG